MEKHSKSPQVPTIRAYAEKWIREDLEREHLTPRTIRKYKGHMRKFVNVSGDLRIDECYASVLRFIDWLLDHPTYPQRNNRTPYGTIKLVLCPVSKMFSQAEEDFEERFAIANKTWRALRRRFKHRPPKRRRPLPPYADFGFLLIVAAAMAAASGGARGDRLRDLVLFVVVGKGGLRKQDAIALNVEDVPRSGPHRLFIWIHPSGKRKEGQWLPADEETCNLIWLYLDERSVALQRALKGKEPVFENTRPPYGRLSERAATLTVRRKALRHGLERPDAPLIEHFVMHLWRHLHADALKRAKMDWSHVNLLQGRSPQGMEGVYSHLNEPGHEPEDLAPYFRTHVWRVWDLVEKATVAYADDPTKKATIAKGLDLLKTLPLLPPRVTPPSPPPAPVSPPAPDASPPRGGAANGWTWSVTAEIQQQRPRADTEVGASSTAPGVTDAAGDAARNRRR